MAETKRCPMCGKELPADAPAGLCPECLFHQGLASGENGGATTSGYQTGFVAPDAAELVRRFPQLEILELLGKGGMGAVYKARQKQLDRLVAVKILPPEAGRDPAFAERFGREARALAQLNHQNIVDVYDFGVAGGLYYLIMEYVDGANLRDLIRGGNLKPEQALSIVPQICEALQFAHDEGVVHRDIKPENILVNRRGQVKIADFGLAKLLGQTPGDVALTQSQQVMGTLHYMAPEQMQGSREVDHRADIYSLGVVFYEMLTGQLPIGRFEPPSRRVQVDVRLDEVVLRTLEADPQLRYQHASDVKMEVESICGMPALARHRIFGHEFRSKASVFGWPLVHIAFGIDPTTGRGRVAKGVVAIGDRAIGVVAIGGAAAGLFACGGAAVGLFALGGVSLAILIAVGGLAIGGFAFGGFAAGVIALGGGAAGLYAFGGEAWGYHIVSSQVKDPEAVRFFESWAENWMDWLSKLGIGLPVAMALLWALIWLVFFRKYRKGDEQDGKSPPRPRLVPVLATLNVAVAVLLMFLCAAPISLPDADSPWKVYELVSTTLGFVMAAGLLAASVGLYLWQPWGRKLTIGVMIYGVAALVVDIPYMARSVIPETYAEVQVELAEEGMPPATAESSALLMIALGVGALLLIGLTWTIGQIVYFTRPRVAVAFESSSPLPSRASRR